MTRAVGMSTLPSGTLTLLFTDIEGSTRLLEHLGARYATLIEDHHAILRAAVAATRGYEVSTTGDGFFVAFTRARDAVVACVDAQRALAAHVWPDSVAVRVRMGVHTGEPALVGDTYLGIDVHRAARVAAAAHGGQVLLSDATRILVGDDLPADCTLRDLGRHRLKDLSESIRLHQLVAPGLADAFPPPRSIEGQPTNLPRLLTSFVGREQALADVDTLLAAQRLVTLTGSGGAGKTRLAIEAGRRALGRLPDGVWFVDLAPITDAGLVPATIAEALSVREQPGRVIADTVLDHLGSRRLLLILDNCEHVVDAAATFVLTCLDRCPHVGILATSQTRLGLAGEAAWRVPPLQVPDPERLGSPGDLEASEGTRLFLERARAAAPAFEATPENASAIARLCRDLDGIPLAIELAAARTPLLTPQQIAQRLHDRFRLLTSGWRGEAPRHQTLRATLDWSYGLLTPTEQALLCRLAIFSSGLTLEAADAVSRAVADDPGDVLDVIGSLVDKSLVATLRNHEIRYHLLETVRLYALDRLKETGRADAVRRSHCVYYVEYAEKAAPHLTAANQRIWLERLTVEHDNLRAALDFACATGDAGFASRLAGALWRFWFVRGHVREGFDRLRGVLTLPPGSNTAARAAILSAAGVLASVQRLTDDAIRYFEESLALRRAIQDDHGVASSLSNLGIALMRREDFKGANALFDESLRLRRDLGDQWGTMAVLHNLGNVAYARGDLDAAAARYTEALDLSRRLADAHSEAGVLIDLGNTAAKRTAYADARRLYLKSLGILRDLDDRAYLAYALEGLARCGVGDGDATYAARLMGAAGALRQNLGAPLPAVWERDYRAAVDAASVALGERVFEAELAGGKAMPIGEAIAYAADPSRFRA